MTDSNLKALFQKCSVLVIGDVMLDEYVWGIARRISPEAPVPVVELVNKSYVPGGAANVACNIAALGANARLCGIVGEDANALILKDLLAQNNNPVDGLHVDPSRPTTTKTRILAQTHQVLRLDAERRSPPDAELETKLLKWAFARMEFVDACIISDYAKGVVTPRLAQELIAHAKRLGKPIVVDPKGLDFTKYCGATVVTPNQREAALAVRVNADEECDEIEVGNRVLELLDGCAVLLTRGAKGMALFRRDLTPIQIPAKTKTVFDVTGAGDTVVSTLAVALAAGLDLEAAARMANLAAGIAVGRVGTTTIHFDELELAIRTDVDREIPFA